MEQIDGIKPKKKRKGPKWPVLQFSSLLIAVSSLSWVWLAIFGIQREPIEITVIVPTPMIVQPTPAPTWTPEPTWTPVTATESPTAESSPTPAIVSVRVRVDKAESLNVRDGPGAVGRWVGTAGRGSEWVVFGKSSDGRWLQISFNNRDAWISAWYVRFVEGSIEHVNVTRDPLPTPTSTTVAPTPTPRQTDSNGGALNEFGVIGVNTHPSTRSAIIGLVTDSNGMPLSGYQVRVFWSDSGNPIPLLPHSSEGVKRVSYGIESDRQGLMNLKAEWPVEVEYFGGNIEVHLVDGTGRQVAEPVLFDDVGIVDTLDNRRNNGFEYAISWQRGSR